MGERKRRREFEAAATKEISFSAEDGVMFADLYSCFQLGELQLRGAKSIRSALAVYDVLDASSVEVKEGDKVVGRRLLAGGSVAVFGGAAWETLREAVGPVLSAESGPRRLDARRSARLMDVLELS